VDSGFRIPLHGAIPPFLLLIQTSILPFILHQSLISFAFSFIIHLFLFQESHTEGDDDEPSSEGELVGAVGGNMLPEAQQDERPKHDKDINKKQGLLRELQHEIERLRLLGPRGDIIRVVDDETSSSSDSEHETGISPCKKY